MLPPIKSSTVSLCLLSLPILLLLFSYFLPVSSNLHFKLKLCLRLSDPCYCLYLQHYQRLNTFTCQYSLQMFLCASYFIFKILWTILNFLLNSGNIFSKKPHPKPHSLTNQSWQKQYFFITSRGFVQAFHTFLYSLQWPSRQIITIFLSSCKSPVKYSLTRMILAATWDLEVVWYKPWQSRSTKNWKRLEGLSIFLAEKKGKGMWKDEDTKWGQSVCRKTNSPAKN